MRYKDYKPTQFDHNIPLEDREEWLVVGVVRTRDSGPLDESNFHSALEILGGESETVEVHRFGHWGPGWFEIIIVDPTPEHEKAVEEIKSSLENYPILDESDLSERESEAEFEAWDNFGASDIRKQLVEAFELSDSTAEWFTNDRLQALYGERSSGTEHSDEGVNFPDSWIWRHAFTREDLARWILKRRADERARAERENDAA